MDRRSKSHPQSTLHQGLMGLDKQALLLALRAGQTHVPALPFPLTTDLCSTEELAASVVWPGLGEAFHICPPKLQLLESHDQGKISAVAALQKKLPGSHSRRGK